MILMAIPASNKLLVPQLISVSPKIMLNFSFLSLQICCRIDMGGKAEAPPLFFYRFRLSINLAIASIIAARANNSFVIALISLNRFLLALHQYSLCFLWMVFDEFCESLDCFPLSI